MRYICDSENIENLVIAYFLFVVRVDVYYIYVSAYTKAWMMREKKCDDFFPYYSSAGSLYIILKSHTSIYPRIVFTNNTPYGLPSNNNILIRLDIFCSLVETTTTNPSRMYDAVGPVCM